MDNKTAKINIYQDPRDKKGKEKDPARTEIICQHFLDAVEKNLYGWLWECPNNGDKCQYMHCLPQGYVLEREKKDAAKVKDDDEEEKTIEELIEEERAALPHEGLTPVTLETFMDWKRRKAEKKQQELEDKLKEVTKKTGGKGSNILSGRALFKYDPTLFTDDEAAADETTYEAREDDLEPVEESKEEETLEEYRNGENGQTNNNKDGNAEVDTGLFAQENVEDNGEEPDFE